MREAAAETAEGRRLAQSAADDSAWRRWGPYVSARQWGTVREDYSDSGDAWNYFPFDQSHRRAYRWGEDGLGGLCDRFGFLNIAVALWNGHDDRLKERPFGLTNPEGNHGEDVKEYYWALDATPTHSWAQWLYRYPQAAFPYQQLRDQNRDRGQELDEYELADTGVLDDNRFFDVVVTHAKASATDICLTWEATNHGPDAAPLDLVPQVWWRNTWAWGGDRRMPSMRQVDSADAHPRFALDHAWLGRHTLAAEASVDGAAPVEILFCNNETNDQECFGTENHDPHPKDAIDRAIVQGDRSLLSPEAAGTRLGLRYHFDAVAPGQTVRVRLRLRAGEQLDDPFGASFDQTMAQRRAESDEFYDAVIPEKVDDNDRLVARRAYAGLMWGKQLFRYSVERWLDGDPAGPRPPASRRRPEREGGRNTSWRHLDMADVISMPDDWEYPWFASWDLAFHTVALAPVDPDFAKAQLLLMCREWVQHPDGQLAAYEWSFSDVNPPVHAWAVLQVYNADGRRDQTFLATAMSKLLLNFGWWVNRKDESGNELFEGGFLGMDNISVFDRSNAVPQGWRLEQSDATSWMAFFCLCMLRIAQELACTRPEWEEAATTFQERFLSICQAVESFGNGQQSLWNEDDGFFYDILTNDAGEVQPVRVRSLVGLVPLLAVANSPSWVNTELPNFAARRHWLKLNRPQEYRHLMSESDADGQPHVTLSLVGTDRLPRVLRHMFDPQEFLSPYGIRSLSAVYQGGEQVSVAGEQLNIRYTPGWSENRMFGGNSNWRGPVWFPLNVLLVDALRTRAAGVGGQQPIEFPTGSGNMVTLTEAAEQLRQRLIGLFRPGANGRRPGAQRDLGNGELWNHPTFSEYFHADAGTGLGASHQTGWTAMVAHLICDHGGEPYTVQTADTDHDLGQQTSHGTTGRRDTSDPDAGPGQRPPLAPTS